MFFESDICWCFDSDSCTHLSCFRHLSHKNPEERIYTSSALLGTEYCLMTEEEIKKWKLHNEVKYI